MGFPADVGHSSVAGNPGFARPPARSAQSLKPERLRAFVASCLMAITVVAVGLARPASAQEPQPSRWSVADLFAPCESNCAISVYVGQSVSATPMTDMFLRFESPSRWQWDDTYLLAVAFSRPWIKFADYFSIDAELGLARRYGNADGAEAWAALYLRWNWFPWNDYLRTSIAIGFGPSLSGNVRVNQRTGQLQNTSGIGIANFFTPELTLGLPGVPWFDAIIRFHHRSQIWNVIPYTTDPAQFWSVGARVRF